MGDNSKIEWTEATWNCLYGCSRVSPGCENCYAERHCHRFSGPSQRHEGLTVLRKHGPVWTGKIDLAYHRLFEPMKWTRGRRIFVNSLSDVFHADVPFTYVMAMYGVMAACPHHTFQLLTKRHWRMADFYALTRAMDRPMKACVDEAKLMLDKVFAENRISVGLYTRYRVRLDIASDAPWPPPNIWLGVSAEDQQRADERLDALFKCEAAVRWASVEPLLGPVDLDRKGRLSGAYESAVPPDLRSCRLGSVERVQVQVLDWVVVGGESGPGARSMDVRWAMDVIDQCEAHGVPLLMKQLGSEPTQPDPAYEGPVADAPRVKLPLSHDKGGDWDEWDPRLRVRKYPKVVDAAQAVSA